MKISKATVVEPPTALTLELSSDEARILSQLLSNLLDGEGAFQRVDRIQVGGICPHNTYWNLRDGLASALGE